MTNLLKKTSITRTLSILGAAAAFTALIIVAGAMTSSPQPAQAQGGTASIKVLGVAGGGVVDVEDEVTYIGTFTWSPTTVSAFNQWQVEDSDGNVILSPPETMLGTSPDEAYLDIMWSDYGAGSYTVCATGEVRDGSGTTLHTDQACTNVTVEGDADGDADGGTGGSCRTVDSSVFGGSMSVSSQSVEDRRGPNPGTDSDGLVEAEYVFNSGDEFSSDEYISAIDLSGGVSGNAPNNNSFGQASLSMSVDGSDVLGVGVLVNYDGSDSDSDSFSGSYTKSDDIETITINISADSSARAPSGERVTASGNADVNSLSITVCPTGPGNQPPVAVDDGSSEAIPIDIGQPKNLNVMDNDYDPDNGPDSLSLIGSPTTDRVGSSVSINGSQLLYDPGPLSYGELDQINYTISDGADTDTATAFVRMVNKTAPVEISVDALEGATYQPKWDGDYLNQVIGDHIFSVELEETAKLFEIIEDEVQICCGYEHELRQPDWIQKDVVQEKTGNSYSAELGLTYTTSAPNQDPTADFTWIPGPFSSSHDCGADGYPVNFSNQSNDPDGDPLSYAWDFNEGAGTSGLRNPTYNFPGYEPVGGTWETRLLVNDGNGGWDTVTKQIPSCNSVVGGGNQPPDASFSSTALSTDGAQHEYRFDAGSSSDPDGSITSYEWEVTDVQFSDTSQSASTYTIDQFGEVVNGFFTNPRDDTTVTYTVQLTVTDNAGATDSTTRDIGVTCNNTSGGGSICVTSSTGGGGGSTGTLNADFTWSNTSCSGSYTTIDFNGFVSTGTGSLTYSWDFDSSAFASDTSNQPSPTHDYWTPDPTNVVYQWPVELTVSNGTDSDSVTKTVFRDCSSGGGGGGGGGTGGGGGSGPSGPAPIFEID